MPAPSGEPSSEAGVVSEFTIDPRYNGPVGWANGGYACGVIADALSPERTVGSAVEVTLRRPVPLASPLRLLRTPDGAGQGWHDQEIIATVDPTTPELSSPPVRPDALAAGQARLAHPGWPPDGPLALCFVCSSYRADGLHVTAGPLPGHPGVTATPFEPAACGTMIARGEAVVPEIIWAALDCPSFPPSALAAGRICLLGTFSVEVYREIGIEESLVVVGWKRERQRRVHRTASAMIDAEGQVVAGARATWIELKEQPPGPP